MTLQSFCTSQSEKQRKIARSNLLWGSHSNDSPFCISLTERRACVGSFKEGASGTLGPLLIERKGAAGREAQLVTLPVSCPSPGWAIRFHQWMQIELRERVNRTNNYGREPYQCSGLKREEHFITQYWHNSAALMSSGSERTGWFAQLSVTESGAGTVGFVAQSKERVKSLFSWVRRSHTWRTGAFVGSHQVDARSLMLTQAEVTLIYFTLAVASCRKTGVWMECWLSFSEDIDFTFDIWDSEQIWKL